MAILIGHPWIAAVVAATFALLWRWRGGRPTGVAAGAWALYAMYEYLVYARILCSGECNIRVDLLLIYPALAVLSVLGLYATLRGRQPGSV